MRICDIERILNTFGWINLIGRYSYFDFETNSRGQEFAKNKIKKMSKNFNKNLVNSNKTRSEIRALDARHF